MNNKKYRIINIIIAAACCLIFIGIDQLTKQLAVNNLQLGEKVVFIKGLLNLRLEYNTGFAFGMGGGYQIIWGIVSIIGCCVIAFFMRKVDFKHNLVFSLCLILLFAGTFGNMIDRLFYKSGVIDFFDLAFMNFAVFNVADSYITIGAILLAVYILFIYKEPQKKNEQEENKTEGEESDHD